MTEQVELERAYVVCLDGMGCGTDACDILICRPSELDANLDVMAWEHHDQWFEPDEDDDGCEPECQAGAVAHEYTPENMERWDGRRSGGGSFTDEKGVIEVWQALGYGRPKFEGDSAFDAWGELVWVSGYGCIGEVRKYHGEGQYRVYLLDSERHRNVNYHWWDLGSLKHLEALGVNLKSLTTSMSSDEIKEILYETMRKARMSANRRD